MPESPPLPRALATPLAQELLHSRIPARLAYVGGDGTARVLPIWFHWTGEIVVLATSASTPKMRALRRNSELALTIDGETPPYRSLQIRGPVEIDIVEGLAPEYVAASHRYYGEAAAEVWLARARSVIARQARLVVRPTWARVLDVAALSPELAAALKRQD